MITMLTFPAYVWFFLNVMTSFSCVSISNLFHLVFVLERWQQKLGYLVSIIVFLCHELCTNKCVISYNWLQLHWNLRLIKVNAKSLIRITISKLSFIHNNSICFLKKPLNYLLCINMCLWGHILGFDSITYERDIDL